MTASRKLVQLTLIAIGIFLILATYFFYPSVKEKKFTKEQIEKKEDLVVDLNKEIADLEKKQTEGTITDEEIVILEEKKFTKEQIEKKEDLVVDLNKEKETNTFKNVEYNGIYDIDNNFTVKSEEAYILKEDQDVVHMSNMRVTLYLNDGRVVVITSDNGSYNKVTYDCYFVDNVKATDGETIVLSDNLDLLSTEDMASVYNNVVVTNENGSLLADKVNYDFETKYYQVSMYNDEKVKIKIIK